MTHSGKREPSEDISNLGFEEALARLIQTDKKELVDVMERIDQEDRGVTEYVEERRESISRGARRSIKRFRL